MLALGIALWLMGIAALVFWIGKSAAKPVKKTEVYEHENR